MLDYIELTNANHFFDGQWLYIKVETNVYRYLMKSYKNLVRGLKAYILIYRDEFVEYNFAFYDEKVRNWYKMLLQINSVGIKTIDLIIKEFSLEEFYELVKKFDYQSLTKIKGIGPIMAKVIIDTCQKQLFYLKLTAKDEAIINSLIKLGYSRKLILQKWSSIDVNLNNEEFIKNLIIALGKNNAKL